MDKTFQVIKKKYNELKAERQKYVSRWEEIAKYVGIRVRPQNYFNQGEVNKDEDLDRYTEDPTACLSVQQSADYLKGIMWGNGNNAISIEPSDDVLELVDKSVVSKWYEYASDKLLTQMNHPNAGLNSALGAYLYDQQAYGTSGVGAFPNSSYAQGYDTNVLIFRPYGVDTLCIDEGKNGLVEIVSNTYQWRCNRLVAEFCERDGGFNEEMFERLPEKVKAAWRNNNLNDIFTIVQMVVPREDFVPGALGVRGCKYVGYWFEESEDHAFYQEDYKDMPIPVARAVKIRGEVYGRASGTMLISTIRCINAAVSDCMVTLGKMVRPPIGIYAGSIFGDDVVDTSENGLTVFNAAQLAGVKNPIVPMQDVGDPTALVNWLIPYLNEKVATAFKIDILLDFASNSNMTATESLQRFSIRGRSIAGMILQQKTEMFEPLIRRCVSICMDKGVLGIDPADVERVAYLMEIGRKEMIIPEAVIKCVQEGKPWYVIKFHNDVEKLGNTEKVEDLIKLINVITALMAVNPQIAMAVDWYKLLNDVSQALGLKENIVSEREFRAQIEAQAQQQAALLQAQVGEMQARTTRENAMAYKDLSNAGQQN